MFGIFGILIFLVSLNLLSTHANDEIGPTACRTNPEESQRLVETIDSNSDGTAQPLDSRILATQNLGTKTTTVVLAAGSSVYKGAVFWPIYRLYRNGPSLHGYGFWRGAPSHEICAALTNVESDFWKIHSVECDSLITKEVQAYVVLAETVLYFSVVLYAARTVAAWACHRARLYNRHQQQHLQRTYSPPRRRSTPLYMSTPPRARK